MKVVLPKINRIFLIVATIIQLVFAILLIVGTVKVKELSVLSLLVSVAVFAVAAWLLFGKKKYGILVALYILTMPIVLDSIATSGHIAGAPSAPKGNFEQLKVQRLVWPYISELGYSYGLDILSDGEYIMLSVSSKSLWNVFFPAVETVYGDYSKEIYNRYTELSMQSLKRKVIPEIFRDYQDYLLAPITTEMNFFGRTGSLNGDNYDDLKDRMGDAARVYYHFSFAAFVVIMVLGLASMFVNKTFPGLKKTLLSVLLTALISLYDIFFILRGFDYKNAVWITLIWGLYWCGSLRGKDADC